MFVWSTGISLFPLIFFVVIFAVVVYSFFSAVRGHGMEMEEGLGGRGNRSRSPRRFGAEWECERSTCRAANPGHARFCRMCGRRREAPR